MTKLLGFSGSLRRDSVNTRLINVAAQHFGEADFSFADLRVPLFDADLQDEKGIPAEVEKLADQVSQADAVILSTPEYNQSMSGVIKNALDWISRVDGNPWENKPVAIMSATGGRSGGGRANFALRLAMVPFRPWVVSAPEILLPFARKAFDEDGQLLDEGVSKRLKTAMEKLREAVD